MGNPILNFGFHYEKMPLGFESSRLLQVVRVHRDKLSVAFVDYDTFFDGGKYSLPGNWLMLLILQDVEFGVVWTTLRKYDFDKFGYYKKREGCIFNCVVVEDGA